MTPGDDGLEDLSQDVYLFGRIRLLHLPWLLLSALAGLLLAAVPVPVPLRILALTLPVAATVGYLHVDGPTLLARMLAYRARLRRGAGAEPMPGAAAVAETVTPICEVGRGLFVGAGEVVPPPYHLAGPAERAQRESGWAAMLATAASRGVQVDAFLAHLPLADAAAALGGMGSAAAGGPLGELGAARARHFARRAAEDGYATRLVVRLACAAADPGEAWQSFRACAAALVSGGFAWEWLAGAYLWSLARAWGDPGAAVRRMAADVEAAVGRRAP